MSFLDNFTNLDVIPPSQTPYLFPKYELIAADEQTSLKAQQKCEAVFQLWRQNKVDQEIASRCRDLWLIIKGQDYPLEGFEHCNLRIQEVDVANYLESRRKRSIQNLILEEVEVTDYV